MLDEIKTSEIPQSHLEFIKKVAKLSVENGIDNIKFSYKPLWNAEPMYLREITGEITVDIENTDGRGRPTCQIRINLDSNLNITL